MNNSDYILKILFYIFTLNCQYLKRLALSLHYILTFIIIVIIVGITIVTSIQTSYAHQLALYTIKGKDYLFKLEWANEPVAVDDKTNMVLTVLIPNVTSPTNDKANGTQTVAGLENSLQMDISAGNKSMVSNLEPAFDEIGSYESKTFYPTIPTTYSFRVYGYVNGTSFDSTFSCNPLLGEDTPPDNSPVQISKDVIRKAMVGGLDCPDDRIGFPEPYVSNHDIVLMLNKKLP